MRNNGTVKFHNSVGKQCIVHLSGCGAEPNNGGRLGGKRQADVLHSDASRGIRSTVDESVFLDSDVCGVE